MRFALAMRLTLGMCVAGVVAVLANNAQAHLHQRAN